LQAFSDTSVVNCTNKKSLNSRWVIEFVTAGFNLQQTKIVANERCNMANYESGAPHTEHLYKFCNVYTGL